MNTLRALALGAALSAACMGASAQSLHSISSQTMAELDKISSGAAARTVVAAACGESVDSVSNLALTQMHALAGGLGGPSAQAYARDSAERKMRAFSVANQGKPCAEMGNLRAIYTSFGFGGI